MFKQAFLYFTDAKLTAMGLVLFMSVFLGVFIWTFLIQKNEHYEKLKQIPFKKGDEQ